VMIFIATNGDDN